MAKSGRVAIAELVSRGKEQLVSIRPSQRFGVAHHVLRGRGPRFQAGAEKRERKGVRKGLELGVGLIDRLTSEEFIPENYSDEYRIRVLGMLDEKSKGKGIVIDTAPA
jgi:non-homologous end joining protein Ku